MGAAYSSLGRTKVLYAPSLVLLGAKTKFLRRKPSVLVALEDISEMCRHPCQTPDLVPNCLTLLLR